MKINKNRDEITLEETLAYLKYLNREKPFNKEEIVIPTKDYEELTLENRQKLPTPKERTKKIKMQMPDDENTTKSINKNRAIKRIIESSFQILQNFNNYEQDEGQEKGDKSSEIQFNIYLKQYNRVLQMIYKKEKDMLNRQAEKAQEREQILQNIYEYIVVEDFRQILPTAILKDKISKTNVEIMISALADSLVILKTNELRIYQSKTATGNFKSIKLHQIQNVDYHTQPYVFIVLSIQKDKERFNVYLKFQSQKNQQKWDRALYCCFIGRKMKTKEKFFLIEYPEEDVKKKEKEETKKIAAFNYDTDMNKHPLDKIYNQKRALSISDRSKEDLSNENEQNLSSNQRGKKMSTVKSIKMHKNLSNMSKQDLAQRSIHNNAKQQRQISDFGNKGTIKSIKFTGNDSQSHRAFDLQRKNPYKLEDMMNRNKTDNINIKSDKIINSNDQEFTERNIVKPFPFGTTSLVDQNKINDELNQQISEPKEEPLPADIKRIHDLERKYVKGIVLEKEKFFFNKAKIIYLKENTSDKEKRQIHVKDDIRSEYQSMKSRQLQYWDFDSNNGQKTSRKQIKITNVNKYMIKQLKALVLEYDNKKQISFICDLETLRQIYEWIDLLQNIYRTKFQNN